MDPFGLGVSGGVSPIDYFTIASTGNGTDFGDNTIGNLKIKQ